VVHKIIEIGRSKAVVIPKELVSKAGLRKGSRVDVTYNASDGSIVLRPIGSQAEIDSSFARALQRGLARYKDVLKELA
jgi:AbrB family looped-hinge helix DNA binding protein